MIIVIEPHNAGKHQKLLEAPAKRGGDAACRGAATREPVVDG